MPIYKYYNPFYKNLFCKVEFIWRKLGGKFWSLKLFTGIIHAETGTGEANAGTNSRGRRGPLSCWPQPYFKILIRLFDRDGKDFGTKDFDHLQECCMGPTGKLVKDRTPSRHRCSGEATTQLGLQVCALRARYRLVTICL